MQVYHTGSISAIYFSKDGVGVAHFDRNHITVQCGLIQYVIPPSHLLLLHALQQRNTQLLLTNHDRHAFFALVDSGVRIAKIEERGLQDDIIENNIAVLKFDPIKEQIRNKTQYIKMMRESSQHCGLAQEKYKALGMVLYYLLNEHDASIANKLFINNIDYFSDYIFKHVQITTPELEVFEIHKQEVHPSLIKGKGKSKEGFSLMSLYETPLSSTGSKKVLRNIFRNPCYDRKKLESRLDLISWVKRKCLDHRNLTKLFGSLHGIDTLLHKFLDSRIENEDWCKFMKTIQAMILIHKVLIEKLRLSGENQLPFFLQTFMNDIDWAQIAKIFSTFSSTLELSEGTIKRGVDLQLDELKKTYDNLPHLLTLYARQQNWNEDCRIVFMSQIGYLIRVPHEIEIPEIEEQNWSLQFVKNSGKFYCNELTTMLDSEYGDIYGEITDRQKKIHFELQNIVTDNSSLLERAYWKICELQCYIGVSIVSNGMCRPRYSSESLIISKGWHILLAQEAIENNAFSFNQMEAPTQRIFNSQENIVNKNYSNRIMLITGPNGSGKTIYMKQISITIFLAHLGFYVPAQFAEIPLVDKIILVESKKSVYGAHNGFESEISCLSRMVTPGILTNKSVVLIDELGASIDRVFAKKILSTLLQYLSECNEQNVSRNNQLSKVGDGFKIPLTIVITHLTDVVSEGLVREGYTLRYLTMDMEKDETFLFKIKPGLVRSSYGIDCAKAFMTEEFINRAYHFWEDIKYKS